jgi:hypothetical protein
MIRNQTGLEPFFAEEVQDLNGLDANILCALRDCLAFIVVLHPRGKTKRPDNSILTRASVWIEQEIAVATYIQRVEKRSLPIIAFKHKLVDREGIRDLLHLNPIEFTNEDEVLAALPERLKLWKTLKTSGIELHLASKASRVEDSHNIRTLEVTVANDTNQRITEYDFEVWLPSGILNHWSDDYPNDIQSNNPTEHSFRFNETYAGALTPRETKLLYATDYCRVCALNKMLIAGNGSTPKQDTDPAARGEIAQAHQILKTTQTPDKKVSVRTRKPTTWK